ncbi:MAG: hypothetical protein Q9174_002857 [Haloplaca sp. 1 TL-2023]
MAAKEIEEQTEKMKDGKTPVFQLWSAEVEWLRAQFRRIIGEPETPSQGRPRDMAKTYNENIYGDDNAPAAMVDDEFQYINAVMNQEGLRVKVWREKSSSKPATCMLGDVSDHDKNGRLQKSVLKGLSGL